MITKGLFGLILAGGTSSRMGSDKAMINFHGKPQKDYLFDLLSRLCEKVYSSIGQNSNSSGFRNPIVDRFDFSSPLNGILSAMEHYPEAAWLTLPVDMPNINEAIIGQLILERSQEKCATCFYDSEGKIPEPLFALWEPSARRLLMEFVKSGNISPRQFLVSANVKILKSTSSWWHQNINTPEDLLTWKESRVG